MTLRMTSKEILLGYINTLSDQQCAEIYFVCKDVIEHPNYMYFDKDGNIISFLEAQEQFHIKLTRNQYSELIAKWGEKKVKECIQILAVHNVQKGRLYELSSYRMINGWVEREWKRLNGRRRYTRKDDGSIDFLPPFTEIDTKADAEKWIALTPPDYRNRSPYVFYLRNKFNIGEI